MPPKKSKTSSKSRQSRPKKTSAAKQARNLKPAQPPPPIHPWRTCPYGQHWVKTHPLKTRPSQVHPEGSITPRHEHCADNPSGRDELRPEEIQKIAAENFSTVKNRPCSLELDWPGKGNRYDDFIAGWVQYWNDVLKPNDPLDPNLVKALIATESRFEPDILAGKKNSNSARGLMQITNETRKILGGDHGDLKDHLVYADRAELNDPNINICACIRWLFEKQRLASSNLKRPATWTETIWGYKATSKASSSEKESDIKSKFEKYYQDLKQCKPK